MLSHHFFVASSKYLLDKFPLNNQLLLGANYIHPHLRRNQIALLAISRLTAKVATCLGKAMHDVFEIKKGMSVENLVDIVKTEFVSYQMENIPTSLFTKDENNRPKSAYKQRSYWKYAYGLAGVGDIEDEEEEVVCRRIDESTWKPK